MLCLIQFVTQDIEESARAELEKKRESEEADLKVRTKVVKQWTNTPDPAVTLRPCFSTRLFDLCVAFGWPDRPPVKSRGLQLPTAISIASGGAWLVHD